MSTLSLSPLGTGVLSRRNPVMTVLAVLVLALGVFAAIDPVTAAVVVLAELPLIACTGAPAGVTARRMLPALIAALLVGVLNAAFGTDTGGTSLVRAGPIDLTTGGLWTGAGIALRVVAIALPGILAMLCIDPTDLADSLIQQCKVPARFAIGSLAALRLVSLLGAEWETVRFARRARGVDAGRSPIAAVRLVFGALFILLVGAIRRGTRLAAAMDARGFDSRAPRTVARRQQVTRSDVAMVAIAVAVAVAANVVSIACGSWHPLFS